MREILFRGKRVDNGEWVEGFLFKYNGALCIQIEGIECDDYGVYPRCYAEVIPETVGQYTGKDIGNENLFEGDIVEWYEDYDDSFGYSKTANGYSVVVWDNENYCWSFKTDNEYTQPFNDWTWENCFIIGNIHDNPELLEGGEGE